MGNRYRKLQEDTADRGRRDFRVEGEEHGEKQERDVTMYRVRRLQRTCLPSISHHSPTVSSRCAYTRSLMLD